jgi:hypothetical protein
MKGSGGGRANRYSIWAGPGIRAGSAVRAGPGSWAKLAWDPGRARDPGLTQAPLSKASGLA